MTSLSTENLAAQIRRKHDVLAQLRDLAVQQLATIDRGDTTDLLKLLASKQQLIVRLQAVEAELDPFRSQDPDARHWKAPTDRARCAKQADDCNRLLEELMQLERHSEAKMTSRRNEVAAQLQQLHVAGQARGAYQQHHADRRTRRTVAPAAAEVSPASFPGLDLVTGD